MLKEYKITLDTMLDVKNPFFSVNTNDLQSLKLLMTVTKQKNTVDLTGMTARIAILKPDKTTVFQECTITDAENGKVEVILTSQAYIVPGTHYAELMIYGEDDLVAVTCRFAYNSVQGLMDDDTVESSDEWQAIHKKVNEAQAILDDLRENGTGIDAQARTQLQVLNEKVDENHQQLSAQLAQTINKRDFIRKGIFQYPEGFHERLPFEIYIDKYGVGQHTFEFSSIDQSGQTFYLNWIAGNDSNDGLTKDKPIKTFSKVMELANSAATNSVNIVLTEKFYALANQTIEPLYTLNKKVNLISDLEGGSYLFTGYTPLQFNWEQDENTYKTSRSAVSSVYDYNYRSAKGFPKELRQVSTLAECKAYKGTWYTDGNTVWVNRTNGQIPTDDIALILPFEKEINLKVVGISIDNVGFYIKQFTQRLSSLSITGDADTEIVINRSIAAHSTFNGFELNNFKYAFLFDCESYDCGYDGFNYHKTNQSIASSLVFEYDIYSHNQGHDSNGTGNATTAHDGIHIIRLNSVGHDTIGPVLADVNRCKSININCNMYDSLLLDKYETKAAYWFDNVTPFTDRELGKAWLINCGGGGSGTRTVNTDENFEVFVKNLEGNNIPSALNIIYID